MFNFICNLYKLPKLSKASTNDSGELLRLEWGRNMAASITLEPNDIVTLLSILMVVFATQNFNFCSREAAKQKKICLRRGFDLFSDESQKKSTLSNSVSKCLNTWFEKNKLKVFSKGC